VTLHGLRWLLNADGSPRRSALRRAGRIGGYVGIVIGIAGCVGLVIGSYYLVVWSDSLLVAVSVGFLNCRVLMWAGWTQVPR